LCGSGHLGIVLLLQFAAAVPYPLCGGIDFALLSITLLPGLVEVNEVSQQISPLPPN
jgi:hypothetical protein